jgi:hypothetical protein
MQQMVPDRAAHDGGAIVSRSGRPGCARPDAWEHDARCGEVQQCAIHWRAICQQTIYRIANASVRRSARQSTRACTTPFGAGHCSVN